MTQEKFEIEKDIPMPELETKGNSGKYWRYYMVMEKMEIGDSFLIEDQEDIKHNLWKKQKNRDWATAARFSPINAANKKLAETGKKFIARWVEVGKSIRVWRAS